MLPAGTTTRFAPSPTGYLHLGNARTALFNFLAARASGGRFVLRIEDTDAARSDESLLQRLLDDLHWLGLDWDEGPDVGGERGPYRQSERGAMYGAQLAKLADRGLTYPCFCTPEALQLSRRAQLASGRPPRYAGTCASLDAAEVRRRVQAGAQPAIRFRVAAGRVVEFMDAIHGAQRFATDDIGDFVVQRADGSVAFFLGNAIDDALMGVTLVLRGDDHLANTPRQLLILEALELPKPGYGHLPLLLGGSGSPLSKREGAASLHDLREQGYLPGALCNYLVRLGHVCAEDGWLDIERMASGFGLEGTSRSAARFDETQLRHWQREAITHASLDELIAWLGPRLEGLGDAVRRRDFTATVRGNLLFPDDVLPLVRVVNGEGIEYTAESMAELQRAGSEFLGLAERLLVDDASDFKAWARAVGLAAGRKGAALYMPLRAALTGETHGPELAPLFELMGAERVRRRLSRASSTLTPVKL